MTVLVFGKTGQVAVELARRLPQGVFLGRDQADLSDPAACHAAILARRPGAVINAAAYTAVDAAEGDEAAALVVNGDAPGQMARACASIGIPLVHISTDYVFDGAGTAAFAPHHPIRPLGAYGRTKAAGEAAVRASGATHAILRTSWVFSAHGRNFVKTMLRLADTRDRLTVVADQIGGPTPAAAIAEACLSMAAQLGADAGKSGTYHLSGAPDTSWADFARDIFSQAGRQVDVEGIATSDFPTPATRPGNSRMDCARTKAVFAISRPDWKRALTTVLQEIEGTHQ